jgi:hypothetical protein
MSEDMKNIKLQSTIALYPAIEVEKRVYCIAYLSGEVRRRDESKGGVGEARLGN